MFAQHGNYTLYSEHNIIIFQAVGAWNVEATRQAISQIKETVDNIEAKTYALIFDTYCVEGLIPDCNIEWSDAIDYWLSRGLSGFARIDDPKSADYKLFIQRFDITIREFIPFSFANNVEEALIWVHSHGFKGFENGLHGVKKSSDY